MKPRQIDDCFERLDEIAAHVVKVPCYKVLAVETGIAPNYLKNVMSRLIRIKRTGARVPRETLLRSLCSEKEFDALMERLSRKVVVKVETQCDLRNVSQDGVRVTIGG